MTFAVGSLVRARGREWVVLPESEADLLVLRPLGGAQDEVTGILTSLEPVESAQFDLPDPKRVGDFRSCRLLRDAVRLSSRAGAGPFRSLARIAVEPRPYQLVPLLMALRQNPVRLLIADDVGIGKTIEACLIARELLDRGEVQRMAVLCPPHLAEQWQEELREKFHVEAELVLPGTAARLERGCRLGESLFEVHPHVVVSMDFIKSDRRRHEFLRAAPELVIVDEAHTCAFGAPGRGARHQRHELVSGLAEDAGRHLLLVTATPHSGKEESFRSLLGFLAPEFARLPEDLAGATSEGERRRLAAHFVQRRRPDIRTYLDADTAFPSREEKEESYQLSAEYRRFLLRILDYARERVADEAGGRHRQRVRWWSALALLRSVASSPAAAAETLRTRSEVAETESADQADEVGRRSVLDTETEDATEGVDVPPGGDPGGSDQDAEEAGVSPDRRRLLALAREAEGLRGGLDAKLVEAARHVKALVGAGFRPIVFCRFIPTADYVAEELRARLPKDVEVASVTGVLPPADREARVEALAEHPKRVLVATDCLSEGINLQDHFDAVVHYDLSWNPTRHEQREGRVDRFGQPRPKVRVLTYFGRDNGIDGIVLDVLLQKHRRIRTSLGVSVPVPVDTDAVIEAIFEGVLLRAPGKDAQEILPGLEEYVLPKKEDLHTRWDDAAEREKRSRTLFAQRTIQPDEVARELADARAAVGSAEDARRFVADAVVAHGGTAEEKKDGLLRLNVSETPRALRDAMGLGDAFLARFEKPVPDGVHYLARTHPVVEALASHVLDTSLDPALAGAAERAGAIRTGAVSVRTTLLLCRFRYDVVTRSGGEERSQVAEECGLLAFEGAPGAARWLDEERALALLDAKPDANVPPPQAREFVGRVVGGFDALRPRLDEEAARRADALLAAHARVREAARLKGVAYRVDPRLPADVLGVYVCLPAGGGY